MAAASTYVNGSKPVVQKGWQKKTRLANEEAFPAMNEATKDQRKWQVYNFNDVGS